MQAGDASLTLYMQDQPLQLCTDSNRNLYASIVTGDSTLKADTFYQVQGRHPRDYNTSCLLLTSHSCSGSMRWAKVIESSSGDVVSYGLEYYAGSIYLAGRFGDTGAHPLRYIAGVPLTGHDSQHYFLARFDTLGNLKWIRFVGANDLSSAIKLVGYSWDADDHSMGIDGQGFIHRISYLIDGVKIKPGTVAQRGLYDLKYDTAGTLQTVVRLGVDSSYHLFDRYARRTRYANSISISKKSGKIFTVLNSKEQYRLCAFAPNGNLIWEDTLSGNLKSNPFSRLRDACYDGGNGVYLSGEGVFGKFALNGIAPTYTAPAGTMLSSILKVDTNGKPVWIYVNRYYGNGGELGSTTILPNGNILASGVTCGIASHNKDSFVASPNLQATPFYTIVSPNGSLVKMAGFLPNKRRGSLDEYFFSNTVDKTGNIYFGGRQSCDTLFFANGIYNVRFPYPFSNSVYDGFITKLGLDCRCSAAAVASFKDSIINEKTVYLRYTGSMDAVDSVVWYFSKGQKKKVTSGITSPFVRNYTGAASYKDDTVCVVVYSACGIDTSCRYPTLVSVAAISKNNELFVYPNPALEGRFSVLLETDKVLDDVFISIVDLTGREVFQKSFRTTGRNFKEEIDLSNATPGVYMIQFRTEQGSLFKRIMVQ